MAGNFEFATAGRIVFGGGVRGIVAGAAQVMGRRALLVTGSRTHGFEGVRFVVQGEPKVDTVRAGVAVARAEACDLVIAVGGGSAIDAGKAIAALLTNPGDVLDYLEVVGRGQTLGVPSAPCIAVPTTSGTGSEVTRNAVLSSPAHRVKASLRSPSMLPRLAVIDPELTLDLPPEITATTGLDALTQLIEPFVSIKANPLTDLYCQEGMRRAARSLRRAFDQGDDLEARCDMSLASLMGGLALANAGLGAVHGFAAAIGGAFDAPHGGVCAALLPHVTAVNLRALDERRPHGDAIARYGEVGRILAGGGDLTAWLVALCADLGIPRLRRYGIGEADIPGLCANAAKASSMKANPIALTEAELREILERAI
jgi:alcohol dehydrogenase class IV